MRVVPIGCIREGMVLGKNIYGRNGEVLLKRDTALNYRYIKRLNDLGYNGIYIEDNLSKEIESADIISDELKNKTVQSIKGMYIDIEKGTKSVKKHKANLNVLLENIINEMLSNSNLVYNMIDLKVYDDYTFYHCVNVAILSIAVGIGLGLDREDIFQLGLGALMHDIGKVFIPIDIINKPGKLTTEEYNIIKTHSKKGYEYLRDTFYLPTKSYVAVLMHHERYNGTGYPEGLKRDEISLFGKIMAISDVYDAFTSDRPYRKALLPSEAIEYIMGNYGQMFDPFITRVFLKRIAPYPVGMVVEMSDGRIGIVMENYPEACLRPKIKIFSEKGIDVKPYIIDLSNDKTSYNVTIQGIVNI